MVGVAQKVALLIEEGDELLREGDVDAADEAYRNAWAIGPRSADAAWSLGCTASHRGQWQESLGWSRQALEIVSMDA